MIVLIDTKAVLPEDDVDPSNQSPPFGSLWQHTQGGGSKAPANSGHMSMETQSSSQTELCPSYLDVKELTEENLLKHQLNER